MIVVSLASLSTSDISIAIPRGTGVPCRFGGGKGHRLGPANSVPTFANDIYLARLILPFGDGANRFLAAALLDVKCGVLFRS